MSLVHLLDYGVGNIGSLSSLFDSLGCAACLTSDPAVVRRAPLLVLPGVGSAETAMRELRRRGLLEPLEARHAAGGAMLGICLGAQLPFSFLEEGNTPGLGFLPGTVARLPPRVRFNTGWRRLDWDRARANGFGIGLRSTDTFFFNHQYAFPSTSIPDCITVEGDAAIPAFYLAGSLCGIQFHPEKSQHQGRILIRNVLRHFHGL